MGPYDWHFDRNHDGRLDANEAYERQDFDDFVSKRGIYAEDEDDETGDLLDIELDVAGLSRDELSLMDDDERTEALEEAGIDADDWSEF